VVSHHLDGFLRERAVSLLRLTAGQRFATFPASPVPNPPPKCRVLAQAGHSPQRVSHPSKNSPHPQPYRVTTTVAFLALPPPRRSEELSGVPGPSPRRTATSPKGHRIRLGSLPVDPRSPYLPRPPLPEFGFSRLPLAQPPSRLCSADESVLSSRRFQRARQPILPWASFPSKVRYISFPSALYC